MYVIPENFLDDATITVSVGTMVSGMPITNVQNPSRDYVARSSGNAGLQVSGHWNGDIRTVDSLYIFGHTGHGAVTQLRLFPDMANAQASSYDSNPLQMFPLVALGDYSWGNAPLGLATDDLLGQEAPYYLNFTATPCASFIINFTACQYSYWQFARMVLGKKKETPYAPEEGMTFDWAPETVHQRTRGGTLRTQEGARAREFAANMIFATEATRYAWMETLALISNRDVVLDLFPAETGRRRRDHIINAKLQPGDRFSYKVVEFHQRTIRFSEV